MTLTELLKQVEAGVIDRNRAISAYCKMNGYTADNIADAENALFPDVVDLLPSTAVKLTSIFEPKDTLIVNIPATAENINDRVVESFCKANNITFNAQYHDWRLV